MTKRADNLTVASTDDVKTIFFEDDAVQLLPEVYEPADDTYLLLEAARNEVTPADSVLEIGTGCGLIAKILERRARYVVATDINPNAVVNARLNGVNAVEADLFGDLDYKFDLVVFNPPYLPADNGALHDWYAKALVGGARGHEVVSAFISDVSRHLAPRGRALILISSLTGYDAVVESMLSKFKVVKTVAEQKFFFETLYVIIGQNRR